MAILVTGGAGFIGSHLVERLVKRGDEVVILDDFNTYYDPAIKERNIAWAAAQPGVHLIRGEVEDEQAMEAAFAAAPIRAVIHFAARAGVRPSLVDPLLYERVNGRGTTLLLEHCRRAEVERLLFTSSSSVYGETSRVPFSEEDNCDRPISPYAATKRSNELICYTYHHLYALPVVCMRLFTVYGPRQRPDLAIHKFTKRIWEGEEIPFYGDGSSARDYTFYSDILDGYFAALDRPEPFGYEIFNLGNSNPIKLPELIELIEGALGRKARIRREPDQPGDVPLTYADISKAQRLLGYQPNMPITEGIPRFCEWYVETYGGGQG